MLYLWRHADNLFSQHLRLKEKKSFFPVFCLSFFRERLRRLLHSFHVVNKYWADAWMPRIKKAECVILFVNISSLISIHWRLLLPLNAICLILFSIISGAAIFWVCCWPFSFCFHAVVAGFKLILMKLRVKKFSLRLFFRLFFSSQGIQMNSYPVYMHICFSRSLNWLNNFFNKKTNANLVWTLCIILCVGVFFPFIFFTFAIFRLSHWIMCF